MHSLAHTITESDLSAARVRPPVECFSQLVHGVNCTKVLVRFTLPDTAAVQEEVRGVRRQDRVGSGLNTGRVLEKGFYLHGAGLKNLVSNLAIQPGDRLELGYEGPGVPGAEPCPVLTLRVVRAADNPQAKVVLAAAMERANT